MCVAFVLTRNAVFASNAYVAVESSAPDKHFSGKSADLQTLISQMVKIATNCCAVCDCVYGQNPILLRNFLAFVLITPEVFISSN